MINILNKIEALVLSALIIEGEHHKQWYLEEILKCIVSEDVFQELTKDCEHGIAP